VAKKPLFLRHYGRPDRSSGIPRPPDIHRIRL